MPRRRLSFSLVAAGAIVGGGVAVWAWMTRQLRPMPAGPSFYVRFWSSTKITDAFGRLKDRGVVRDQGAMRLYAWMHRGPRSIPVGTYQVQPGEDADQILRALESPVRQMLRMPETNWARRDANLLEKAQVSPARDYLALVDDPAQFKDSVDFPLPASTLEGYLLPDTYDFPPLLGARSVVERRLRAFDTKVWRQIGEPRNLARIVTIASLVELEAGTDADRAMIAGVIENRLKKDMPLEIDASLMYALGKWRRLHFKDYKEIKSPYNLYLHKGLPPTPICSPSLKSIEAAMHPVHHKYIFYVALPGGKSLFSETFAEHKKKIKLRMAALKALEPSPMAALIRKAKEGSPSQKGKALTLPPPPRGEGSRRRKP